MGGLEPPHATLVVGSSTTALTLHRSLIGEIDCDQLKIGAISGICTLLFALRVRCVAIYAYTAKVSFANYCV